MAKRHVPVERLLEVMTEERRVATDAFEAFCIRVHPRLVGSLTLYCGDRELAADLAQEALARACRDWVTVGVLEAPEAWVHRVGMNLAHSWFRRLRLRRREEVVGVASAVDSSDAITVRRAVAGLPRRQREAIVLRYFLDWSVADTAAAMGCADGTVRALTSQALASLRSSLGGDWEVEG